MKNTDIEKAYTEVLNEDIEDVDTIDESIMNQTQMNLFRQSIVDDISKAIGYRLIILEKELKEFKSEFKEFKSEMKEFKEYVKDVFKRNILK